MGNFNHPGSCLRVRQIPVLFTMPQSEKDDR
jgi:hypothetical protein